jgi:hypothetical protein
VRLGLVFVSEADHAGRGPIALFLLEQTGNFLENVFEAGGLHKNIAIPAS